VLRNPVNWLKQETDMPDGKKLTTEEIAMRAQFVKDYGYDAAVEQFGVQRRTLRENVKDHKLKSPSPAIDKPFDYPNLPSKARSLEDIKTARREEEKRTEVAEGARTLIPVKINIDGPVAVAHLGDPHVDSPSMMFSLLEKHVDIINKTEGMFAAAVGDYSDNWVGRLGALYSEATVTAEESWKLVEWLITGVQWLYLLKGNHDLWSGHRDPLNWMRQGKGASPELWEARINLKFPNKRNIRINARHDFPGGSIYNPGHAFRRASMIGGVKDHIMVCGHRHISSYDIIRDPQTGLLQHAMRVAGYKRHDLYAKERGLVNLAFCSASVTIIDPQYSDDDPRLITVLHDVEEAADYLTFKRRKL
jgi:hypothetical protein